MQDDELDDGSLPGEPRPTELSAPQDVQAVESSANADQSSPLIPAEEVAPGSVVPDQREVLGERLPIGRWSPVHPDHCVVMRWVGWIRSAIVALVFALATIPIWFGDALPEAWFWAWPLGGLVLIGSSLLHAVLWPTRRYAALRYRADATGIEIREGVVWKSSVIVASSRIQHTEVVRGPLQRTKDLSTLVIHTAGSAHDTVELPGLSDEIAEDLRDWLIAESARARRD